MADLVDAQVAQAALPASSGPGPGQVAGLSVGDVEVLAGILWRKTPAGLRVARDVAATISAITRDVGLVDDVASATFELFASGKVLGAAGGFDGLDDLRAFVFGVVKNVAFRLRSQVVAGQASANLLGDPSGLAAGLVEVASPSHHDAPVPGGIGGLTAAGLRDQSLDAVRRQVCAVTGVGVAGWERLERLCVRSARVRAVKEAAVAAAARGQDFSPHVKALVSRVLTVEGWAAARLRQGQSLDAGVCVAVGACGDRVRAGRDLFAWWVRQNPQANLSVQAVLAAGLVDHHPVGVRQRAAEALLARHAHAMTTAAIPAAGVPTPAGVGAGVR